uniref:Uncharacterized protein n=1 Tax=viral metagenome TaxID=1070528 RepID=A0A6C0BEX3_9ZZZZ
MSVINNVNTVQDFVARSSYVPVNYNKNDSSDEKLHKRRRIHRTPCDGSHDSCMNDKYKCCICMDKRQIDWFYEGYVDGVGVVKNKSRAEHYCPSCKSKFLKTF